MRSSDTYKAQLTMEKVLEAEDCAPIVRELALKAGDAQAEPFERYAGSALRAAGALELTAPGSSKLLLKRAAGGQIVRLAAPNSPLAHAQQQARVLEDALNRLLGICGALTAGIGAKRPADQQLDSALRRRKYERHGIEYPLWSDTQRGAHVTLPPLGDCEPPTEAYFNEVDWRMLDTVASTAHLCFQYTLLLNKNRTVFGVNAPHAGEWDLRTRLAAALGSLEPSLRLTYRYDCDTSRDVVVVHFGMPPVESFPAIMVDGGSPAWPAPSCGDNASPVPHSPAKTLDRARIVYAMRMSALIGACCFGSSRKLSRAFVVGREEDGRARVSCAFDREAFVRQTLPVIDTGALSAPCLRFDPEGVAEALGANGIDYIEEAGASRMGEESPTALQRPVLPLGRLVSAHLDPSRDKRELPADLQALFHAKRVCDLRLAQSDDAAQDAVEEARLDSHDSTMAAVARLENVVAEQSSQLKPPSAQPDARPLYCETPLQRLAIALLDDELNIAAAAEAFLDPDAEQSPSAIPSVFYYPAPRALAHAHVGLADLYRKLGDVRGAETQADRCLAIAPTMPVGYALKADALAGRGRFREAMNVLSSGMRCMLELNDLAMLQHDMALLLWRMGRQHDSIALHMHVAFLPGIYADKSADLLQQLPDGAGMRELMGKRPADARNIVAELDLPLVPDSVMQFLVARAAVGLADFHAPKAAAPYAQLLATFFPANRTIATACNSLEFGID